MTTVEIIRQEILRRIDSLRTPLNEKETAVHVELLNLLEFIYTANAPSEELEQAANAYSENVLAGGEDMFDAIADGFIAGANWQKEQDEKVKI